MMHLLSTVFPSILLSAPLWWWIIGGGIAALIIALVVWISYQETLDDDSR